MPFFIRRKRAAASTPNDNRGSGTSSTDNTSAVIKNNKSNCKRTKISNQPTLAVKDKPHEYEEDVYINKQQRWDTFPHDEPQCISSIIWQLSEEDKVIKLADFVGITAHEPFLKQQDECDEGCWQSYYMQARSAAYDALEEHYTRLDGNRGLAELQEDVACFKVSINSNTDEKENYGQNSSAASDNNVVQHVGDFSFDSGSNEFIGDDLVDELGTSTPVDAPPHNSTPSSTTTPLELNDISCVRNGVEDKRKGPSPTNATADLSSFTKDISPSSDDSNNDSSKGEPYLPPFDGNLDTCVGESNVLVSPKKVNPKEPSEVVNTSTTQRRDELQQQQQGDISCGGSDKPLEVAQIEVHIIVRAPPGKLGLTLTNKMTNNQIILMNKSGAYVSHVDNDSVLVQQVSKGDSIISIDGINVSQHTCKQVQSILKSNNNLERVLVFAKDISITNAPWYYVDPQSRRQGPFSGVVMRQWLEAGFFNSDLLISQSNSGPFLPLEVYFPPRLIYIHDKSENQTVSWLFQCMQYTSEVGSIRRTDTWDNEEKMRLLLGIYLFGYGKWKSIQLVVSTRTNDQVGQKANNWCPCMSTIEATGALSSLEDVQKFYKQTLPNVESIINQLEKNNHNDKEVNKKRWQERCAQGSKQAQQLLSNESASSSSSSTVSFNLGSTHSITTNLDTCHINLDYAKSIFQSYMIRELEGRLESGIKTYGKASLQLLYNLEEVASLDTAKRVDLMGIKNPTRRRGRGGVYTFKFNKDSLPSLPLSPILEEEDFIVDDDEQSVEEAFFDYDDKQSGEDDDEPEDENEKEKHGMTGSFGGRHDWYLFKGKNFVNWHEVLIY